MDCDRVVRSMTLSTWLPRGPLSHPWCYSCYRRAQARFEGFLDFAEKWLDCIVARGGPFYIAFAIALILCVAFFSFSLLVPLYYGIHSPGGYVQTVFGLWVFYNVLFNYYNCATTPPGSPPAHTPKDVESAIMPGNPVQSSRGRNGGDGVRILLDGNDNDEDDLGIARWCTECNVQKPPYSHHCHICKRCVLKMDHHCPWMHNCIGFRNLRYFLCFLLYMWMGSGNVLLVSTAITFDNTKMEVPLIGVIFCFTLSFAVFVALSLFLSWHVYLVSTAQTTIDFHGFREKRRRSQRAGKVWHNKFDLGCRANWCNAFDLKSPWWALSLLIPHLSPPPGDGCTFTSKASPV